MSTQQGNVSSSEAISAPLDRGIQLISLSDSEYEREKFLCEYAGMKRCPAQYSQLVQHMENQFGCKLSMECAISRGEVFVTLMCQEDLDNVIQLMNSPGYTSQSSPGSSPGSSCPEFNIRLFKEPSPVSSPDGAFIRSPDVEPPLGPGDLSPPPGTIPSRSSFPLTSSSGSEPYGEFIPEPDSLEYQPSLAQNRFLPDNGDSFYESVVSYRSHVSHMTNSRPFSAGVVEDDLYRALPAASNLPVVQHSFSSPAHYTDVSAIRAPVNWSKGRKLGSGSFGQVYKCYDRDTGCDLAVKEVSIAFPLTEATKELVALKKELQILEKLSHPRIVQYYGYQSNDDGSLAIFVEFMPGGSVQDQISQHGPLTEAVTRHYTRQVLEGLLYLHQQNIIHRDIKGANILRDSSGNVKLSDFGTSKQLQTLTRLNSVCGTWYYMSPDIIAGGSYDTKTDIWSLGCTVVEMLSGKPPWHDLEGVAVIYNIGMAERPKYRLPDSVSEMSQLFVERCFVRDPMQRPSADQLIKDPFVCDV